MVFAADGETNASAGPVPPLADQRLIDLPDAVLRHELLQDRITSESPTRFSWLAEVNIAVVRGIAAGMSDPHIAKIVDDRLTAKSVPGNISRSRERLGAHTRPQLVYMALFHGRVDIDDIPFRVEKSKQLKIPTPKQIQAIGLGALGLTTAESAAILSLQGRKIASGGVEKRLEGAYSKLCATNLSEAVAKLFLPEIAVFRPAQQNATSHP